MEREFDRLNVGSGSHLSVSNGSHSPSTSSTVPFSRDGKDDGDSGGFDDDDDVSPLDAEVGAITESAESSAGSVSSSGQKKRRVPDMQLGMAGIILRESQEDGCLEMLLVQEAKRKCYGKWYMPAGHLEPGETVEAGCRREVREETGFECSVDHLLATECRGSGWYRHSFTCTITGGKLKNEPDRESLKAGWFRIDMLTGGSDIQLRCRDFLPIVEEAARYHRWKKGLGRSSLEFRPVLNVNEVYRLIVKMANSPSNSVNFQQQPGLFIEFVIVYQSPLSGKMECLVHGDIRDEKQLLESMDEAFPTVEFGFEFFFPMAVSKCYRHIFSDGHKAIDIPEAVIGMWCMPIPFDTIHQGLRLRILSRHKKTTTKAEILVPQRYHWITLEAPEVLAALYLREEQFRPRLTML